VETLNEDPWGRPYMIVRKKMRAWAPPVTESLHPQELDDVLDGLFPSTNDTVRSEEGTVATILSGANNPRVPEITRDELDRAVKRMGAKNTASGPDGVPGRAWVLAMSALKERLRDFFNELLGSGWFPCT